MLINVNVKDHVHSPDTALLQMLTDGVISRLSDGGKRCEVNAR